MIDEDDHAENYQTRSYTVVLDSTQLVFRCPRRHNTHTDVLSNSSTTQNASNAFINSGCLDNAVSSEKNSITMTIYYRPANLPMMEIEGGMPIIR